MQRRLNTHLKRQTTASGPKGGQLMFGVFVLAMFLLAEHGDAHADLVPFPQDGKWGFTDSAGKLVIHSRFDRVGRFSCGLAPVNVGWVRPSNPGKWGYVDATGNLVISMTLNYADEFSEGLALVSDDREQYYL